MRLGNFSISLAVKDIHASLAFYEKLGFRQVGGDIAQNWVVLKNETTKIGLFQGMFEKNMLTFNPGWDHERRRRPISTTFATSKSRSRARASPCWWRPTSRRRGLRTSCCSTPTATPSWSISTCPGPRNRREWPAKSANYCRASALTGEGTSARAAVVSEEYLVRPTVVWST